MRALGVSWKVGRRGEGPAPPVEVPSAVGSWSVADGDGSGGGQRGHLQEDAGWLIYQRVVDRWPVSGVITGGRVRG